MSYNLPYGTGNAFGHHQQQQQQQYIHQPPTSFPTQQAADGANASFGHYSQSNQPPKNNFTNSTNSSSSGNTPTNPQHPPSVAQGGTPRNYGYKMSTTTSSSNPHASNAYNYNTHNQQYGQTYPYTSDNGNNFNGNFHTMPQQQTWYGQTQQTTVQSSTSTTQPPSTQHHQPYNPQQYQQQQQQQQMQYIQQQQYLVYQMAQQLQQSGLLNNHPQNQFKSPLPVGTKPQQREQHLQSRGATQNAGGKPDQTRTNWSLPTSNNFDMTQRNQHNVNDLDKDKRVQSNETFNNRYGNSNVASSQNSYNIGSSSQPRNNNFSAANIPSQTSSVHTAFPNQAMTSYNMGHRMAYPGNSPGGFPSSFGKDPPQLSNANPPSTRNPGSTPDGSSKPKPTQPPNGPPDFPPHPFPYQHLPTGPQLPMQVMNNFQPGQNNRANGMGRGRGQGPTTSDSPSGVGRGGPINRSGPGYFGVPGMVQKHSSDGPEIPPFPEAWQSRDAGDNTGSPKPQHWQQPWMHGPPTGPMNHDNWGGDWSRFPPTSINNSWRNNSGGQQQSRFNAQHASPQQNSPQAPMYNNNSRQGRGQTRTNRSLWTPSGKKSMGEEDKILEKKAKEENIAKDADVKVDNNQAEIKAFLYAWLGKSHFKPTYETKSIGDRPTQTFKCELNVDNYTFVGVGTAPNKKDAQTLAAWNFVDFLVKEGQLNADELPPRSPVKTNSDELSDDKLAQESDKKTGKSPSSAKSLFGSKPDSATKDKPLRIATKKDDTSRFAKPAPGFMPPSHNPRFSMPQHQPPPWRMGRPPEHGAVRNRMGVVNTPHMEYIPPLMGQPLFPPWEMGPIRPMRPPGPNHAMMIQPVWGEMEAGWWPPMPEWPMPPHPFGHHARAPHSRSQNDFWHHRDMEERRMDDFRASQEEWQHPEDMFIYKMIKNQKQAESAHKDKPMDWLPSGNAKVRPIPTSDDRHVISKHESILPESENLEGLRAMVEIVERALKLLSDKFVQEDSPPAKVAQETESEEVKKSDEQKEDEASQDDNTDKSNDKEDDKEAKNKIKILKRPEKRPRGRVLDERPRILSGVNRVGAFAQNLLTSSDRKIDLVLLCLTKPTLKLLQRIVDNLPDIIAEVCRDDWLKVSICADDAAFKVYTNDEPLLEVIITLTSLVLNKQDKKETKEEASKPEEEKKETSDKEEEKDNKETNKEEVVENGVEKSENNDVITENENSETSKAEDPEDMLPEAVMLKALASLRQDDWFQNKAYRVQTYQLSAILTRIFRDLQINHGLFKALDNWTLSVLVFNFLVSSKEQMSPGDAFRRCFEVLAGGILLPGMPGIQDPCEKPKCDILDRIPVQDRLDITRYSQLALRQIAFRDIHKVLHMGKVSGNLNKMMGYERFQNYGPHDQRHAGDQSHFQESTEKVDDKSLHKEEDGGCGDANVDVTTKPSDNNDGKESLEEKDQIENVTEMASALTVADQEENLPNASAVTDIEGSSDVHEASNVQDAPEVHDASNVHESEANVQKVTTGSGVQEMKNLQDVPTVQGSDVHDASNVQDAPEVHDASNVHESGSNVQEVTTGSGVQEVKNLQDVPTVQGSDVHDASNVQDAPEVHDASNIHESGSNVQEVTTGSGVQEVKNLQDVPTVQGYDVHDASNVQDTPNVHVEEALDVQNSSDVQQSTQVSEMETSNDQQTKDVHEGTELQSAECTSTTQNPVGVETAVKISENVGTCADDSRASGEGEDVQQRPNIEGSSDENVPHESNPQMSATEPQVFNHEES